MQILRGFDALQPNLRSFNYATVLRPFALYVRAVRQCVTAQKINMNVDVMRNFVYTVTDPPNTDV